VQFVDGAGRLLRLGAKVVKNAAGFDLPKFFVGSLGRFGILVEITFKVFPRPASCLTLTLDASTPDAAVRIMTAAAGSRWELDALDWLPDAPSLALRLAGPAAALPPLAQEILGRWPGRILAPIDADAVWQRLRECRWAQPHAPLVKVAVSPVAAVGLARGVGALTGARMHLSAGGNVAFISPAPGQCGSLDGLLREKGLAGVMLRGEGPLWMGRIDRPGIARAVKNALDGEERFPSLDD
jgi:glycolate oxidase FAD binding subunit